MSKPMFRGVITVIVALQLALAGAWQPVMASMISSGELLAVEQQQAQRAKVDDFLAREDVAAELARLGVDEAVARERAQALSDQELAQLAERIDEVPAGAGVIEVLGVTFLVLLVLEFLGVINIFNR